MANWLGAWHLPRVIGAGLVLAALVGMLVFAVNLLRDDATALIESLPQAAQKVRQAVRRERHASSTALDKLQQAAMQLQKATREGAPHQPPPERGVTRVRSSPSTSN